MSPIRRFSASPASHGSRKLKPAAAFCAAALIACAGLLAPAQAHASKELPKILINGINYDMNHDPVIEKGRTLVPLRGVFEAMGAQVEWNQFDQSIKATRGTMTIELTVNKTKASINGNEVELDVPARNLSGATMVPLRFVSESLGAYCWYNPEQNLINITDKADSDKS
ncbi:copper amine oxidase N-terminal domain-containing protein [Paenibacillus sp. D51F]